MSVRTPSPLRVVFGIRTLANPGGGAERVLCTVTRRLAERGHDVHVVTFDADDSATFYNFSAEVSLHGVGVGDPSRSARANESVRRLRPLRRVVRGLDPDVVVGFMHSMFIPLGLALLGTSTPVVASEHSPYVDYLAKPGWHRAMIRLVPALTRTSTVTSERVRETFPPGLSSRMSVIENPVDLMPMPTDVERQRRILAVGRLFPEKDHRVLVDAFALLAAIHPDWQLRIIGDGELRETLARRIDTLGLAGRAEVVPSVTDVRAELAAAAIMAVPSRYESFGLVSAEALAAGLPVVGFADCLGTNELIEHGLNGLLVDGGATREERSANLARGLERLLLDESLRGRLGAAGPESVRRFDPERIADAWEALLRRVVAG